MPATSQRQKRPQAIGQEAAARPPLVEDVDLYAVGGRLRERQQEIERAVLVRVRAIDPDGIIDNDTQYAAGLHEAVIAAVDYGLTAIQQTEQRRAPIPASAIAQARRAALTGVSVDTVLRRYAVGSALLQDFVIEELDGSPPAQRHDALREVLRIYTNVLDCFTTAIATEYHAEHRRLRGSGAPLRDQAIRELLREGPAQTQPVPASPPIAEIANYEFDGNHVGMIVRGTGAAEAMRQLAVECDRRLLSVPQGDSCVWAWLGGRRQVEMADLLGRIASAGHRAPDVVFAVGEPADGLAGWRTTHRQAQAALLVALRRPQQLTRYADVALLSAALLDRDLARTLATTYLVPLQDARGAAPILCETLRAYLAAEHNASSAAHMLGVARKTVESRLRTVQGRLERSLHSCPPELQVALALERLDPATWDAVA